MPRPSVYKICDTHEEGKEVFIKTTINQNELFKIIYLYQIKLCDMCETMAFCVDETVEILESFGCKKIEDDGSFKSCWKADIYEIWEWGCSSKCPYHVTDEDMNNPKYTNKKADEILLKVYERTLAYYNSQDN